MNPKLNQIIAVTAGKKSRAQKLLTQAHRAWDSSKITGISRTYQPLDEEGDKLPPESKRVQTGVKGELLKVMRDLAAYHDAVLTQESGNTEAKADVVVDEEVILSDVPVTVLLFLEKQLVDLFTFASNLPVLPADRDWHWDGARDCWATPPEQTLRSLKVPTTHVLFEPTEHQPGQAQIINVDKTVGTWTTVHLSGALPAEEKAKMVARVVKLQEAVKKAREGANSIEVEQKKMGEAVLNFIFGE